MRTTEHGRSTGHRLIPAVGDDEARRRFPDGWTARKPYLRVVPLPR